MKERNVLALKSGLTVVLGADTGTVLGKGAIPDTEKPLASREPLKSIMASSENN